MSPRLIVQWWINCWGYLDDEQQAKFKAHPAIDRIASHGREQIKLAIQESPKLHEIAERLDRNSPS